MSRVKEWGSIQSVGKQSAPLSSCLFFGHWTLEQTKAEEFLRSQKRKALRFFSLIIPVFCGNNQALYILYLLHSWLFGLTNISSHTLPSQPFLENTPPPPLFYFLENISTFQHGCSLVSVSFSGAEMMYILWGEFLCYWVGRALGSGNTYVD